MRICRSFPPKLGRERSPISSAFNEKNRGREMPYFEQELFFESQARGPLPTPNI